RVGARGCAAPHPVRLPRELPRGREPVGALAARRRGAVILQKGRGRRTGAAPDGRSKPRPQVSLVDYEATGESTPLLSLSRGLFLTASLHLASVAERDPGALARGPGVVRQAGQALAEQVGRHEAGAGGVPGAGGVLEDRGQREGGRVMKVYLLLYHPDHEQRYPVPVGVYLSRAGAAAARPGAWLVFDEYYRIPD